MTKHKKEVGRRSVLPASHPYPDWPQGANRDIVLYLMGLRTRRLGFKNFIFGLFI